VILATYVLFTFIWELFVPQKKQEGREGTEEEKEALLKQQEINVAAKTR
jgi:hypothetical protein